MKHRSVPTSENGKPPEFAAMEPSSLHKKKTTLLQIRGRHFSKMGDREELKANY